MFQIKTRRNTRTDVLTKLMRALAITLVSAGTIFSNSGFALQPIADIVQTPLELTPTSFPNIMILLDDSGSMDFEVMTADANSSGLFFAPNPDGTQYGSTETNLAIQHRAGCELVAAAFGGYAYGIASSLNHYVPDASLGADKSKCYVADQEAWRFRCASFNKLYYDPTKIYQPWPGLRSDGTPFVNADPTAAPLDPYQVNSDTVNIEQPNQALTGIDAFRYYTCERDSAGNFFAVSAVTIDANSLEKQNFANWFSYHRSRHLRVKALLGNFIVNQQNNRIGLTQLNPSVASLEVEEMNESLEDVGAKRNLLSALYASTPTQTSAFASRYDARYIQVARYLQCRNTSIFSGVEECPAETAPAGTCQPNHIILASDGFLNTAADTDIVGNLFVNANADSSNEFSGGPFVPASPVVLVNPDQYRSFADIAMTFYKEDLHNGNPVNLADRVELTQTDRVRYPDFATNPLADDETLHQHVKTHMVTFEVPLLPDESLDASPQGNPLPLRFPGTDNDNEFLPLPWLNPVESDIGLLQSLYHAAYSGRGEVISATDSDVNNAAQSLANTISQGIGSTTPIAINTQIAGSGVMIYRTFFDSTNNSGDLVAQLLEFDLDGDLIIPANDQVEFEWSAASELDELVGLDGGSISERNIITYSEVQNDGIEFNLNDLDPAQRIQLQTPEPNSLVDGVDIASERIDYLKGDTSREGAGFDIGQFRVRPEVNSTGGGIVHNAKLGTIANSAPVFVGRPPAAGRFGGAWPSDDGETYFDFQNSTSILDRIPTVLVGANDGMLHVFNADSGREEFAYIPSFVYDNLSELTFPEYKHRFFVDGTPTVEDVYIRIDGTSSPSWNTIVVGGLGAGGSGYYALDITDVEAIVDPIDRVLWEFAPDDDPDSSIDAQGKVLSDLGLTFSEPVITMSNAPATGDKQWVAIFGNGYNSTSASGDAVIYVLFIDRGIDGSWAQTNDLIKINLGGGGGSTPNGISDVRAIDRNGDGTADYIYAGDLQGKLHVVNISSTSPSQWDDNDNNYVLYEAEYFGEPQPITTRPTVVNFEGGTADDVIVVFATGSYFTQSDATDDSIQTIYGVVDDFSGTKIRLDQLTQQRLINEQFVDPNTSNVIDVRVFSDSPTSTSDKGWFIDFNVPPFGASLGSSPEFPGEKAVRGLLLRSGIIFTTTIIPQPLSCDPAPGGFSLAIDPQTGAAGEEPIFDINNDGVFNDDDSINLGGQSGFRTIVGTKFDSTLTSPVFIGDNLVYQEVDGNLSSQDTNTAQQELIGRQAWREVEF